MTTALFGSRARGCRALFVSFALGAIISLPGGLRADAKQPKPWTDGPTPALVLEDMRGRPVRLQDFKGKVVLINFWATWCEPCRDEMPSIQRLRQKLSGKPFEVLTVNVTEPRSRVETFLTQMQLDLPVLLDHSGDTARNWRARILPATFIIGMDGRIRYAHAGELDWAEPRIVEMLSALMRAR